MWGRLLCLLGKHDDTGKLAWSPIDYGLTRHCARCKKPLYVVYVEVHRVRT